MRSQPSSGSLLPDATVSGFWSAGVLGSPFYRQPIEFAELMAIELLSDSKCSSSERGRPRPLRHLGT